MTSGDGSRSCKLGLALLKLSETSDPPVRFAAGSHAFGVVLKKLDGMRSEAEQWRELSTSTDSRAQPAGKVDFLQGA